MNFLIFWKVKNGEGVNSTKLRKEGLATRLAGQFKLPIAFIGSTSNKATEISNMLPYSPAKSLNLPFSIPILNYNSDLESLKCPRQCTLQPKYPSDFNKN